MMLERIGPDRFIMVDPRMADWIASRIPGMSAENLRRYAECAGIVIGGKLIAGMAIGGEERGNCEITFAADSPRWATRETIAKLMAWPFRKCHRVTTRIHAKNKRAIRFNLGIGFRTEGLIREGWGPGEDCVLLGLLKSEAPQWMLAATHEMP